MQVLLLDVFTSTSSDTDIWKNIEDIFTSTSTDTDIWKNIECEKTIPWLILHKQQNWYLYNVLDRFRCHQNKLVLAQYQYILILYQNRCSPN